MKSSDTGRKMTDKGLIESGFLSNGPLYSLLAVYMPVSALSAALFLFKAIFQTALPLTAVIFSAFACAVIASLYCDFMKDVKSDLFAADIRGAVITTGFFYFLTSVFRRELPFEWRFRPGIVNILSAVGALYAWYSVILLKQLFSARRHFEIYTELYREDQLQRVLLEDSGLLYYTDDIIIKRRHSYVLQLVIIGVLALICVLIRVHLSLSMYLLLIGILAGGVCICGFFEVMRWEQYYAGEGIALSAADRLKRTAGMGIFVLLCAVLAVPAASNTSLLPFSDIVLFFVWLLSLFAGLFPRSEINFPTEAFESVEMLQSFLPAVNEKEPGSFMKWLMEYGAILLKYALVFFAAAAFILFMISPLLNRGRPSAGKLRFHERLKRIIAEWLKGILTALSFFYALFTNNKTAQKLNKHNGKEIRRTATTILKAYSQAKKQDMRRSVTLFARLIIWGGEVCQLTWKPSYAPGEYCGVLAASAAALYSLDEKIIRCGEIFEQALYSAEVLSAAEQQEFKKLVEVITSTNA